MTEHLRQLTIPLLQWYGEHARTLPWRSEPAPYRVWVSEIMLQQTRVQAVLGYYERFMEALPDVKALADVDEERLMKLWQGLGYYSRARNLQTAARQIMERFGGVFPDRYEDILRLAGVGEYTAGAVASIAFGVRVPAVDGNVLRVLARIVGDRRDIMEQSTKTAYRSALAEVMPSKRPGDYNQALMELGATVCLPNGAPLCDRCPARDFCAARREGTTAELPLRAAKKARRIERRTVLLITYAGRIALRKRPARGLLAGLWEYPNEEASAAECLERWGLRAAEMVPIGKGKHLFTHIEWHMTAVRASAEADALPDGWVWASAAELRERYARPNAFRWLEDEVLMRLGEKSHG